MVENETVERDHALGGLLALAGTIAFLWGLWLPGADIGGPDCQPRPTRTADICHPQAAEPRDPGATDAAVAPRRDGDAHRDKTILELGGGVAAMVGAVLVFTATKR
ncbi:hypothetical protein [Nocardia sp. BMG111209]|uniref:hypothetical protein n=1 Tax=Nocardia sp. BMG111209 TaxID=1160137 RepID=UPI000360C24A|nr:hypothetical protein [Nocardia sp. BMG111209]